MPSEEKRRIQAAGSGAGGPAAVPVLPAAFRGSMEDADTISRTSEINFREVRHEKP